MKLLLPLWAKVKYCKEQLLTTLNKIEELRAADKTYATIFNTIKWWRSVNKTAAAPLNNAAPTLNKIKGQRAIDKLH